MCQPPNSPDFIVLDLGFFNAIQSLQYKRKSSKLPKLVKCVQDALSTYEYDKLLDFSITLKPVFEPSLSDLGGNFSKYLI